MVVWYGAGLAIARSRVQILPTAAVYQRQLSVPSLWGRLMSNSESWGVNGYRLPVSSRFAETRFAETRFAETRLAEIRV